MNDLFKTNVKSKLESAMESEGIRPSEAARILGFHANYISMIKNPNTWMKCPSFAWEAALTWINSGQKLNEYSEKHGHVIPEKPKQVISKVVDVKPASERIQEVKQEPKRATKGELIDMLIEEKELLKSKVDAIDVLLKHYIQ